MRSSLALVSAVAAAVATGLALPAPRRLQRRRPSPGPRDRPDLPWLRLVAAVAVAVGVWTLLGGALGLIASVPAAAGCWLVTGRMEPPAARRRRERLVAGLPLVVDLMSACLTAGLSPTAALERVGTAVEPPLRDELIAVTARLRLGVDPVTAWRDLAAHPQLGVLGRTVSRATESGASVADAMLRLSDDLRARSRSDVEARARAVGVKAAVPLGVCLLPAFVLVGVVPLVAGSLTVLRP